MNGIFTSLDVSVSALKAQRSRMNVVANNIAQVNTTHDEDGKNIPYRRKFITFGEVLDDSMGSKNYGGVEVMTIDDDMSEYNERYEPGHQDADERGYIKTPNVDISIEMVDMIEASRSYEANISAIEIAKSMINNTFEIIA